MDPISLLSSMKLVATLNYAIKAPFATSAGGALTYYLRVILAEPPVLIPYLPAPAGTTGLPPWARATRTAPGTCTSIPEECTGTATTAASASRFVPSQNSRASRAESQACLCSPEAIAQSASKSQVLGEAPKNGRRPSRYVGGRILRGGYALQLSYG